MLYPFMTLNDHTEIVHSEILDRNRVQVRIEKPVYGGFHSAICYLPDYKWEEVIGFSTGEISGYQELIESVAHVIYELAQNGGIEKNIERG